MCGLLVASLGFVTEHDRGEVDQKVPNLARHTSCIATFPLVCSMLCFKHGKKV